MKPGEKRRLVILGPGHPFRGGVARTTTELVRSLQARGHEVHFLTPRRQYPGWLYPGRSDLDREACERLDCAAAVLDPLNPLSWSESRRRALALDGDAWILPYWTWAWAGLWRFLLRRERPPAVAVVHNPADHDAGFRQRLAARLVLGRCQALFTHARALEDGLAAINPGAPTASYPLPPPNLDELPSTDTARAVLGLPADCRVAMFLGLIRPYKGVDLLLEAIARLPAGSDWFLVVAGEPWGDLGDRLSQQVRRLGISDRVRLEFGWVPEAEVPRLLAAADLVVLPYRSGSQSAVAPLALGAGVPVLSTAVGGLPEVVRHGVDGWLVAPGSVEELTRALEELDRPRLAALADGALRGRGRFTWDGYAEALEGLLENVVGAN
jgi:D-inositol-3-phosphate glycosyltransferase